MSPDSSMPDRRRFFREALGEAVRPLANYLERKLKTPPLEQPYLRPPGVIEESRFLDTCYHCGACVEACPADAIQLRTFDGDPGHGTPGIDPDLAACILCDGFVCTHACPSGGLQPVTVATEVRMGLAIVAAQLCLRWANEPCTACVDACPLGTTAIRFMDDGPPMVSPAGCVGCGVCQLRCPTQPKAVTVRPRMR